MRTSVYTFLLITCLLLTPCAFSYAGTDDSGLQVFTVDFSKQLGESADVAQEDTLFSPYCYNMFSSGNGLTNFFSNYSLYGSERKGIFRSGVTTNGVPIVCELNSSTYEILIFDGNISGTWETVIPSSTYNSLYAYKKNGLYYVLSGNNYVYTDLTTVTTLTGKVWQTTGRGIGRSFTSWKNRLWVAGDNLSSEANALYYSAASDWTDFSSSSTSGGVILLSSPANIIEIIGTKYGLYIFTSDNGIWLLNGSFSPNSWELEKISNLEISVNTCVTKYNDTIFLLEPSNNNIYLISGISFTKICDIPFNPFGATVFLIAKMNVLEGRFLCLPSSYSKTTYFFDLKKEQWFQNGDINGFVGDFLFVKHSANATYGISSKLPGFEKNSSHTSIVYPWAYQTSWMTLDGNASTRKEIDRIEFDYQGGTTSVYLYYAYGNGSSAYASTTLTAPVNTRLSTYVWNAPIGRQQSNRFYLYFLSSGTQTMTTNYILKQARIYYRNIGNYKTNSLR